MKKPPRCPFCGSINKFNATRCRVCGQRLHERRKDSEVTQKEPLVLERVMTGEVFTAVLGKTPKGSGATSEKSESKELRENAEEGEGHKEARSKDSSKGDEPTIEKKSDTIAEGRESENGRESIEHSERMDSMYQDRATSIGWVEENLARARASFELRKYDKALAYCNRILEKDSGNPRAWTMKGDIFAKMEEHQESVECYTRALKEDPSDQTLWYRKGDSLRKGREFSRALKAFDNALALDSRYWQAWLAKGSLLEVFGKIVEAFACFMEVLRLNPNHAEASLRGKNIEEILWARGQEDLISRVNGWNDLPTEYRNAADFSTIDNPEELKKLAGKKYRQKKYPESLYFYDQLVARNSMDGKAWDDRGHVLARMGKFTDAVESFEKSTHLEGSGSVKNDTITDDQSTHKEESLGHPHPSPHHRSEYEGGISKDRKLRTEDEKAVEKPDSQAMKPEEVDSSSILSGQEVMNGERVGKGGKGTDTTAEEKTITAIERKLEEIVGVNPEDSGSSVERQRPSIKKERIVPPLGRVKTYVEGLDEALGGGIPKGHVVLICGSAGTLKSSFAFYTIYKNVRENGSRALYVTLEQSMRSLLYQMKSLGMEYGSVRKNLRIFDVAFLQKKMSKQRKNWMDILRYQIGYLKKKWKLNLLVLDSMDALRALAKPKEPRSDTFRFFEWLRDLDLTSLLISETPDIMFQGNVVQLRREEDFLADGIIHLRLHFVNEVNVQRRIRCIKMRGTYHKTGYLALSWDKDHFGVTKVMSK